MTFVYRTAVLTFLCTGLLLGSGALVHLRKKLPVSKLLPTIPR